MADDTYSYRYTGAEPRQFVFGEIKPGATVKSTEPLHHPELKQLSGPKAEWLADVDAVSADAPTAETTSPKEG